MLAILLLGMARAPAQAGPFEDGVSAYQRGDYATALRLLRPLADQGSTEAQSRLGSMYILGRGVRKDYAEAARWYRKAAEQGNAAAQNNLAVMYLRGDGVGRDFVEAVRWYRKAADQENGGAQFALGIMHEIGQGVRKDYAEAVRWYRRAGDNGDAAGQAKLGFIYSTGQGAPQSHAEAAKWYRLAADQGNTSAQFNLGIIYYTGQGVPQNHAEAAKWYRFAADQGHAGAQFNLAALYSAGHGVPQNYAEAAKWSRLAADQGNADALFNLGVMYEHGLGVPQNFVWAHMWFNLAGRKIPDSQRFRDLVASRMTIGQVAEAQRLASEWRPRTNPATDPYAKFAPDAPALSSTGSGFFVTRDGHLLTNAHVVKGCKAVQARRADGDVADARVVATSIGDDLALLKVEKLQAAAVAFRASAPVRQGEGVTVYGFPLTGLLASTGNLTIGHVTALSGPRDDPRLLQISAAVQPGNSGGPVFDNGGNVVGVVVSKLDALAVAGATGDVPQNINFAIKASVATNFLEARGVEYGLAAGTAELTASAVVDRARAGTVRVDCLK